MANIYDNYLLNLETLDKQIDFLNQKKQKVLEDIIKSKNFKQRLDDFLVTNFCTVLYLLCDDNTIIRNNYNGLEVASLEEITKKYLNDSLLNIIFDNINENYAYDIENSSIFIKEINYYYDLFYTEYEYCDEWEYESALYTKKNNINKIIIQYLKDNIKNLYEKYLKKQVIYDIVSFDDKNLIENIEDEFNINLSNENWDKQINSFNTKKIYNYIKNKYTRKASCTT